jgi:hypothetical protein
MTKDYFLTDCSIYDLPMLLVDFCGIHCTRQFVVTKNQFDFELGRNWLQSFSCQQVGMIALAGQHSQQGQRCQQSLKF